MNAPPTSWSISAGSKGPPRRQVVVPNDLFESALAYYSTAVPRETGKKSCTADAKRKYRLQIRIGPHASFNYMANRPSNRTLF